MPKNAERCLTENSLFPFSFNCTCFGIKVRFGKEKSGDMKSGVDAMPVFLPDYLLIDPAHLKNQKLIYNALI